MYVFETYAWLVHVHFIFNHYSQSPFHLSVNTFHMTQYTLSNIEVWTLRQSSGWHWAELVSFFQDWQAQTCYNIVNSTLVFWHLRSLLILLVCWFDGLVCLFTAGSAGHNAPTTGNLSQMWSRPINQGQSIKDNQKVGHTIDFPLNVFI